MPYSFFNSLKLAGLMALSVPALHAQESLMVVEAYSGKILVASNAAAERPVASLTKIATGVITVDWSIATGMDLGKVRLTVPQSVTLVGGPNPMNLQPGDSLTLRDALYSMLLGSDNLAALSVAHHVGNELLTRRGKSGDPVVEFVAEMNRLTKALGMRNTRFANPHGLERPRTRAYSTAADVARLSIYAMRRNAFNFIVRQNERQVTVHGAGGSSRKYVIRNTNELIGQPGILGVKTGMTTAAGPCVSICMDREPLVRIKPDGTKGATPRRLIVVVLNSPDRFNRARGLVYQGWSVYDAWLAAGSPVRDAKREIITVADHN
jgi:D-alanyl-D-alanine carboxypeptidase